jgi:hypothetical protein
LLPDEEDPEEDEPLLLLPRLPEVVVVPPVEEGWEEPEEPDSRNRSRSERPISPRCWSLREDSYVRPLEGPFGVLEGVPGLSNT